MDDENKDLEEVEGGELNPDALDELLNEEEFVEGEEDFEDEPDEDEEDSFGIENEE
jgi:hypothetical protein